MFKSVVQEASRENLYSVLTLIENELISLNCKSSDVVKVCLSFEELFSNVVNYAYPKDKKGLLTIKYGFDENDNYFYMVFIDDGVKYNPLENEDPNIKLSVEERKIGGLGIFLCKKFLDKMEYEYKDDQNVLTTAKKIEIG